MDKITDTKTQIRLKQWAQIIQTCQASGMTVIGWCNQNNINPKSYYYWLRKIRSMACESVSLVTERSEPQIVPVSFRQANTAAAITVHLPSISVDIPDRTSTETIEAVLSVL